MSTKSSKSVKSVKKSVQSKVQNKGKKPAVPPAVDRSAAAKKAWATMRKNSSKKALSARFMDGAKKAWATRRAAAVAAA